MKKKLFVLTFFLMSFNIINSEWIWLNSGTTAELTGVEFLNEMTGFVVGGYGGILLKTTNAGTNWLLIPTGSAVEFMDIHFINPNTAFIVGGRSPGTGEILKSTDGGANWTTTIVSGTTVLSEISFPTTDTGYVVGWDSKILKTTNQGTTGIQLNQLIILLI